MNYTTPTLTVPDDDDPSEAGVCGQTAEDVAHHRSVLNELIEIGMNMARVVHAAVLQQAVAIPQEQAVTAGPVLAELGATYDRVSRSVRRSIMLARVLGQALPEAEQARQQRVVARKRILRVVEDTIARERRGEAAERLSEELQERLDTPDLDDDIAQRPVAEIIREICADLGLVTGAEAGLWKRRTPADAARLHAVAVQAGVRRRPLEERWAEGAPACDGEPAGRMVPVRDG